MLRRTAWMQLLALCARREIRIVVPAVVLRESIRHWRRQAEQSAKNVNGEIQKLSASFGVEAGKILPADLINAETYEKYLVNRLRKVGAELPDLPDSATLENLLERDLSGRKPFATSGKGFRDALNWETVLELAHSTDYTDRIFWVSKNSDDFSNGKGALHPDLAQDLLDADQVVWVSTLAELLERAEIKPLISGLATSATELEEYLVSTHVTGKRADAGASTLDYIRDALIDAAERLANEAVEGAYEAYDSDGRFGGLDLPNEVSEITIASVDADPDSVQWQVYETFDETTLLVTATIGAELSFEGFADKSDALHAEDYEVLQWDWNDHVSHVAFVRDALLNFQLRIEEGVGVDELEFESAEPA